MRVLVADALGEGAIEALENIGTKPVVLDKSKQDLAQEIKDYDVLIVRSTKVDKTIIDNAPSLGLIVRAGAGTDTIDTDAAARKGIFVSNVPGKNAIAVAELTMGLLLAIDRAIPDGVADLRAGKWDKARYRKADGLAGKTMAIIGLGSIGQAVAQRAKAFDMTLIALRKPGRPNDAERKIRSLGIRLVDTLEDLLANADVVSLHIPGGQNTQNFVDAEFLKAMKPNSILLNTSRGSTIDQEALIKALDEKNLRAGLDVFPDEPSQQCTEYESPLASHPRVVGTHHIGASTAQAQNAVLEGTLDVIKAFRSGDLKNCVNIERADVSAATLTVRHIDQVGVLAGVLDILKAFNINVQEMNNRVFAGKSAAVATIECATVPGQDAIDSIASIPPVVGVHVQAN